MKTYREDFGYDRHLLPAKAGYCPMLFIFRDWERFINARRRNFRNTLILFALAASLFFSSIVLASAPITQTSTTPPHISFGGSAILEVTALRLTGTWDTIHLAPGFGLHADIPAWTQTVRLGLYGAASRLSTDRPYTDASLLLYGGLKLTSGFSFAGMVLGRGFTVGGGLAWDVLTLGAPGAKLHHSLGDFAVFGSIGVSLFGD